MPRKLTRDEAAAMSALRKINAGGRPVSRAKRCACGKFTIKTAKVRYHACSSHPDLGDITAPAIKRGGYTQ